MSDIYDFPSPKGLAAALRFYAFSLECGKAPDPLPRDLPSPRQIAAGMHMIADTLDSSPPPSDGHEQIDDRDWEEVFEEEEASRASSARASANEFRNLLSARREAATRKRERDDEGQRQLEAFQDRGRRRAMRAAARPRPSR